jgi:hypothetical protein
LSVLENNVPKTAIVFEVFFGARAAGRLLCESVGEIDVVPVVVYPMDLKSDCEFLYQFNPLPEWGKCWRDFEKEGDWRDALYPIGNGVKQVIEKARLRYAAS